MIARRIGQSLRTVCRFSLRRVAPFCSSSSDHPRFSSVYSDAKRGGSAVYRHALKFQRPTTIKWQPQLENSVNFIGTVVRPLEKSNVFGVYTLLHVKNSHSDCGFKSVFFLNSIFSHELILKTKDTSMFNLLLTLLGISIRLLIKLENIELNECVAMLDILLLIIHHLQCLSSILLAVGGDMAQLCQKHLKPNDFIYVTGQLHSYSKVDKNGKLCLRYKVYFLLFCRNCSPFSQHVYFLEVEYNS